MPMHGKFTITDIEAHAHAANDDTCRTRLNHMGGRWLRVVYEGNAQYSYWYDMPKSSSEIPRQIAAEYLRGEVEYRKRAKRGIRAG